MRLTNVRPYGVWEREEQPQSHWNGRLFLDRAFEGTFRHISGRVLFLPHETNVARGKIIIAGPCSKTAFVAFLVLTTVGGLATASAQPADIKAIDKAFQDHYARGNYPAAQIEARELERLAKTRFGADHPYYAVALNKLGIVFHAQGKYTDAEGLFERALTIREKALGANHRDVGRTLNNLANVYRDQGNYGEAEGLYKRALVIREQALGASHPDVAQNLNNMAILYEARGESGSALVYSRKATAAVLAHRTAESTGAPQTGALGGLVEPRASYFQRHVANLAVAARKGIEPAASLAREAIEVAQWASQSSVAGAVQQMSTRFASGADALASLVRDSQDLAAAWRDKDKALLDAVSKGRHESSKRTSSPDCRSNSRSLRDR
jgi:tetratricopeptide (TPR) repeat protein